MIGRLRALAERPLDRATGRIVVFLAGAVCVGLAPLVVLGLTGPGATDPPRSVPRPAQATQSAAPSPQPSSTGSGGSRRATHPSGLRQDPQDDPGTAAHRRAHRELAIHRALQHVPWRRGAVSIVLVGAKGTKAVLAVRAASVADARRAFRAFLRRFHDDGRAYLPRFRARGGHRGR